MLINPRRNEQASQPLAVQEPANRAPYNPFARTLATTEASFGVQTPKQERAELGGPGAATGRGALDVDAFKNLLLTGKAIPPATQVGASTGTPPQRLQDSSSSTDTSSISRQSIFESMQIHIPESPRTSFDHSASEEDDHDEHASLMGQGRAESQKSQPRKPKHGKRASSKGPQTVSFADFDEQIPSPTGFGIPGTRTPPIHPIGGILRHERPSTPRSPSDLNKPLPPPPPTPPQKASPEAAPIVPEKELSPGAPAVQPTEATDTPQLKKVPPPPPAARRQAQQSSNNALTRTRSGSSLTQAPVPEENESELPTRPPESTTKAAPPPPPSRRSNTTTQPTPSTVVEKPPILAPPGDATPAVRAPAMPPPPPRRNSSKTTSVTRTPSNASRSSVSLVRSESLTTSSAPPVPPPRRGGSNRNSMDVAGARRSSGDHRRASGQSFDSERNNSLSSLQQVGEAGEADDKISNATSTDQPPQRDILADMEALQREVDAMRVKAGRPG